MVSDPANVVIQNCEYYLRVVTIFQVCLKQALLDILHDPAYNGLPLNNEQHTHALILVFKTKEEKNLRHVLKPWQWDIIYHVCTNTCAANCQRAGKTNTQDFDITIMCVLLSNYLVGLPPPTNGWKKPLAPGDYSKGACGIRARDLRNKTTGHGSYLHISTKLEFDDCCSEIEKILKGLGYKDMKLFEDLKTSSLDPYVQNRIEFFSNELKAMKVELAAFNCDQNASKAVQEVIKVDIDTIKVYQVKIKAFQDACKTDNDAIKIGLDYMSAKQKAMEIKQTAIELEIQAMNLIIENLKDKRSDLENSCDRRYIETTSVAVDTNQDSLKLVSDELKKKYMKKYGKVCQSFETSKSAFEPVKKVERNKSVMKLSLVPSPTAFEMDDEKEHINMIQKRHKDSALSSIAYNDIFHSENDYVLMSGVPGSGKTTLVETILYEWSIDEIWKEDFDFMFIIYFRQLVKFRSNQTITCQMLLSHFYPGVDFSILSHHKTLLILDGFDEFACKEDFRKTLEEFSPFVQAVYDLVDPNNPSIQFTRLLTSRPGSFPVLFKSVFNASFEQHLRIFKIVGFDDENIEQYIYNHLQNADLSKTFLITLQKTPILKNFMTIPFFCWGICCLINNKELALDMLPVTATAIYANILTLFIRNHGLRNPALKLSSLFKLKEFQEMISMLSNMAWSLYKERKLIFNSDEFDDMNLLIQSGLVIKVESECGEMDHFQFTHYSFHEFLCALHAFYNFKDIGENVHSDNINMMIAGLCGGKVENSSSDVFVRSFVSMKPSSCEFASIFYRLNNIDFFANAFYEFQNQTAKIEIEYLEIFKGSYNEDVSATKLSHFKNRCDNRHFSIEVFRIESFPYLQISPEEGKVLTSMVTCCTTIECDIKVLLLLKDYLNFPKIKEVGRLKNLYIHCYPFDLSILSTLSCFEPSEVSGVLSNLESVKILGLTKNMDDYDLEERTYEEFLEGVKQTVYTMNDSERPLSFNCYYASRSEISKYTKRFSRCSIFDIGVL